LLPFLSENALYNSLNFSDQDTAVPNYLDWRGINRTSYVMSVGLYLCPSDAASFPESGGNNYRGSMGPSPVHYEEPYGYFRFGASRRAGEIRDGLSQTLAFSEKTRGDGDPNYFSPQSEYFITTFPVPITADIVRSICQFAPSQDPNHEWRVGESWLWGSWRLTYFNHVVPPNHRIPDCSGNLFGTNGSFAARSFHPGGVNALMADGTVRFLSDAIVDLIWQAIGTVSNSDDANM
jgi:prepilin-type processing-associated H-X9-DG protein